MSRRQITRKSSWLILGKSVISTCWNCRLIYCLCLNDKDNVLFQHSPESFIDFITIVLPMQLFQSKQIFNAEIWKEMLLNTYEYLKYEKCLKLRNRFSIIAFFSLSLDDAIATSTSFPSETTSHAFHLSSPFSFLTTLMNLKLSISLFNLQWQNKNNFESQLDKSSTTKSIANTSCED